MYHFCQKLLIQEVPTQRIRRYPLTIMFRSHSLMKYMKGFCHILFQQLFMPVMQENTCKKSGESAPLEEFKDNLHTDVTLRN